MKALVKYEDGPNKVELRDVPEPVCGPEDVKIEVKACGICGTDLHIVQDAFPWPVMIPLGHEYSGVVIEVGKDTRRLQVGDRVTSYLSGGYARYVVKKSTQRVTKLPDNISFEEGTLFEPISVCTHAVFETSGIRPLDLTLVSGPGCIGLGVLQAVKAAGGRAIVSGTAVDEKRLEVARELGADHTVNIERDNLEQVVKEVSHGRGLDLAIECSGAAAAIDAAAGLLKRGKYLLQMGIPGRSITVDMDRIVNHHIRLFGTGGFDDNAWEKSIELARIGTYNLKKMISHTLPLSQWREAFQLCADRQGLKVLITPD